MRRSAYAPGRIVSDGFTQLGGTEMHCRPSGRFPYWLHNRYQYVVIVVDGQRVEAEANPEVGGWFDIGRGDLEHSKAKKGEV